MPKRPVALHLLVPVRLLPAPPFREVRAHRPARQKIPSRRPISSHAQTALPNRSSHENRCARPGADSGGEHACLSLTRSQGDRERSTPPAGNLSPPAPPPVVTVPAVRRINLGKNVQPPDQTPPHPPERGHRQPVTCTCAWCACTHSRADGAHPAAPTSTPAATATVNSPRRHRI